MAARGKCMESKFQNKSCKNNNKKNKNKNYRVWTEK